MRRALRIAEEESYDDLGVFPTARKSTGDAPRLSSKSSSASLPRMSVCFDVQSKTAENTQRRFRTMIDPESEFSPPVVIRARSAEAATHDAVQEEEEEGQGCLTASSVKSPEVVLPVVQILVDGVCIITSDSNGQPIIHALGGDHDGTVDLQRLEMGRLIIDRCSRKYRQAIESRATSSQTQSHASQSLSSLGHATSSSLSSEFCELDDTDSDDTVEEIESDSDDFDDDSPNQRRRRQRNNRTAKKCNPPQDKKQARVRKSGGEIRSMTIPKLKQLLKENGLPVTGRKSTLVARLSHHMKSIVADALVTTGSDGPRLSDTHSTKQSASPTVAQVLGPEKSTSASRSSVTHAAEVDLEQRRLSFGMCETKNLSHDVVQRRSVSSTVESPRIVDTVASGVQENVSMDARVLQQSPEQLPRVSQSSSFNEEAASSPKRRSQSHTVMETLVGNIGFVSPKSLLKRTWSFFHGVDAE